MASNERPSRPPRDRDHLVSAAPIAEVVAAIEAVDLNAPWSEIRERLRLVHSDWVNGATFSKDGERILTAGNDGKARLFDISDPFHPVQIMETKVGAQVNMTSQSWDGKRVYFTSSLLANWDKTEAPEGEDLQYFKAYRWDGKKLEHQFTIDFIEERLGLPHQMRFGAYSLYGKSHPGLALNAGETQAVGTH